MNQTEAKPGKDTAIRGAIVRGAQKRPPANSYIVEDYPYGSRQRCRRATWIELATGGAYEGQLRIVHCTTNPRRNDPEGWNKPHPSTYSYAAVAYLDSDKGHVHADGLTLSAGPGDLDHYRARWRDQLDPEQLDSLAQLERTSRQYNPRLWEEHERATAAAPPDEDWRAAQERNDAAGFAHPDDEDTSADRREYFPAADDDDREDIQPGDYRYHDRRD